MAKLLGEWEPKSLTRTICHTGCEISAILACLVAVPPLQHAKSAEGIPAARGAEALHDEIGLAVVAMLQRPAAVVAAGALDDVDRVHEASIAGRVDGLEVIECAKNVVMPARREGEAEENRLDDCAGAMRAEQSMHHDDIAVAALGGPHRSEFPPAMKLVLPQSLEGADRRVHRRMRRAAAATAVPAAVGHLLVEEMFGHDVETVIVILEGA